MKKIKNAVKKIINEELKRDLEAVNKAVKIEKGYKSIMLQNSAGEWFRRFDNIALTERQEALNIEEQKQTIIKKLQKQAEKEQEKYKKYFEEIERAEAPKFIKIDVTFLKSSTWGWCPFAEMWTDEGGYVKTSKASGCGYDKESTATAEALNTLKGLKKLIFEKLNKKSEKDIYNILKGADARDLLGYGLRFFKGAYFEYGVGVECHLNILQNLGYKLTAAYHGRTSNFYQLERKGGGEREWKRKQ